MGTRRHLSLEPSHRLLDKTTTLVRTRWHTTIFGSILEQMESNAAAVEQLERIFGLKELYCWILDSLDVVEQALRPCRWAGTVG